MQAASTCREQPKGSTMKLAAVPRWSDAGPEVPALRVWGDELGNTVWRR